MVLVQPLPCPVCRVDLDLEIIIDLKERPQASFPKLHERRLPASFVMAPKKKPAAVVTPASGVVHGWKYRIQDDGQVKMGTHAQGAFKRWGFRLTSYDDYSDAEACIRAELGKVGKGRGPERSRSRSRSRSPSPSPSCSPRSPKCLGEESMLGLGQDLLAECDAFVAQAAVTAEPPAIRTPAKRTRMLSQPYSPSKDWSGYERSRSGERHDRTREVSYGQSRRNEAELQAALQAEHAARERMSARMQEIRGLSAQLREVAERAAGGNELHKQVLSSLQLALLELLEQEDETPPLGDCADGSIDDELDGDNARAASENPAVLFVASALRDGAHVRLVLGSQALVWGPEGALGPLVQLALEDVEALKLECKQVTPFRRAERCTIRLRSGAKEAVDFPPTESGREMAQQFSRRQLKLPSPPSPLSPPPPPPPNSKPPQLPPPPPPV